MLSYIFKSNSSALSKNLKIIIFCFPILLVCFQAFLFAYPPARDFGIWLVLENNPIELLTFIVFLFGGVYGVWLSFKISKSEKKYVVLFYSFFSACLLLLAMEEISWGQSFFHFETPEKWKTMNYQGETTLHNLNFMQSSRDNLLLIFGVSGLVGIILRNHSKFQKIGVPVILLSWFLMIVFLAFLDVFVDFVEINKQLSNGIERFAEITELLIAGSSFLYLWLKQIQLKKLSLVD
ncbi:hypothetical protein [uncultured Wocania sp.]|uniref:hypothetical protein n=1 Tax=uncultured Wocania sp. TaxID=2834404 RepID=UPI0030FC10AD